MSKMTTTDQSNPDAGVPADAGPARQPTTAAPGQRTVGITVGLAALAFAACADAYQVNPVVAAGELRNERREIAEVVGDKVMRYTVCTEYYKDREHRLPSLRAARQPTVTTYDLAAGSTTALMFHGQYQTAPMSFYERWLALQLQALGDGRHVVYGVENRVNHGAILLPLLRRPCALPY